MNPLDFFKGPAAFGMRVRHLLDDIEGQLEDSLAAAGCNVKATTTGIVLLLTGDSSVSIADVARRLRYSHQLATKRVRILEEAGLVKLKDDPADGRRRVVKLTRKGKTESQRLLKYLDHLERAYESVFDDVGVNALDVVVAVDEALRRQPLQARMSPPARIRRRA